MKRGVFRQSCPACGHVVVCDQDEMTSRLRSAGRLRRAGDVDPVFLFEVLKSTAATWSCARCANQGLKVSMADEDDEWPGARRCDTCGGPISAERLRAAPDSRYCVRCQQQWESNQAPAAEFCPHCGNPMVTRSKHGSGITRYVLVCPECNR